jgi:hypothetical protein
MYIGRTKFERVSLFKPDRCMVFCLFSGSIRHQSKREDTTSKEQRQNEKSKQENQDSNPVHGMMRFCSFPPQRIRLLKGGSKMSSQQVERERTNTTACQVPME